MGKTKGGDLLLTVAAIGLRISIAFTALGVAVIAVGTVVILVAPPADFARQLANGPPALLPLMLVCFTTIAAMLILGTLFALTLLRIIGTVKNGDPFVPANADRLTRMGWYALGATVGGWVIGAIGPLLERYLEGTEINVSPVGSLAFVITLFILARVFRQGAAMRDDLIGTV